MPQSHIATAADYADAMMTARRAKNWLFILLALALLGQLAIFFVARYTDNVIPAAATETTQPSFGPNAGGAVRYLLGLTTFLGVILPPILAIVLLLITTIMLIGRLVGVSRVVSAFVWCLVLAVLLFPWQAFLAQVNWKIPGVLFTWAELQNAKFDSSSLIEPKTFLNWARFVVFPLVALFILLSIQSKSKRGLRMALGEDAIETGDDTSAGVA